MSRTAAPGAIGRVLPLWLLAVLVAGADFVSVLPASRAYSVAGVMPVVAAAAFLSVAITFLLVVAAGWPPLASYGGSALGAAALLVSYAGAHPGSIVAGLAGAPNRLLTETLPLSGSRASVSGLVLMAWIGGAATAEVLLRSERRRRPSTPAGLAIPIVVYLACYAATSTAPHAVPATGALLLESLAGAVVVWRAVIDVPGVPGEVAVSSPTAQPRALLFGERPLGRHRGAFVGVGCAVAVSALAFGVTRAVPGFGDRPLQLQRRPPVAAPVLTDPVGTLASLRDSRPRSAPVTELTLTTSEPSNGYLGMAYLDDYDGSRWEFRATFRPTGGRVPTPPAAVPTPLGRYAMAQRVQVDAALPLPLLPALDRPIAVTGPAVLADQASGMVLLPEGAKTRGYAVTSLALPVTLQAINPADGISPPSEYPGDSAIPPDTANDLATAVRFVSTLSGKNPSPTVGFLQAAASALRRNEKQVEPGPAGPPGTSPTSAVTVPTPANGGGTSLSEVIVAVTVHREATPEQFATFLAMVARYLGVPTRLVSGFRAVGSSGGASLAAGSHRVTDREAWTWDEVAVAGLGWVVCDPAPDAITAAFQTPPEQVQTPATTLPPRRADAVPASPGSGGHALAPRRISPAGGAAGMPSWAVGIVAASAILIAGGLAWPGQAAMRRSRRRRRRRNVSDPAESAIGAWLELLDGLARAGMRPSAGDTGSEIAIDVARHFGPEHSQPAGLVADLADRAMFCPSSPPSHSEAELAWSTQAQLLQRVLGGLDHRQRARAAILVGDAPGSPRRR